MRRNTPEDNKPPKKKSTFRKWAECTTALGTAAGIYLGTPYIIQGTDSYELPPVEQCNTQVIGAAELTQPLTQSGEEVVRELVNTPEAASSLVINAALNSAGDHTKMGLIENAVQIEVQSIPRADSQEYQDSCAIRAPLKDVRMFNPALYEGATYAQMKEDPSNYLYFHAIAHFKDPNSNSVMLAFYEPQTGTISLQSVGLWHEESPDRALAAITENNDRAIPREFAEAFLQEVRGQVRSQKLEVNQTTIFAHSMGVSGGLLLKGLLETGKANQLVFGSQPTLSMVEGFYESGGAQEVSRQLDIPMEKLTRNSITARSGGEGTANFIAAEWDTNHPVGQRVYSLTANGTDTHALPDIAIGLLNGKRTVTPYKGTFSTSGMDSVAVGLGQFVGKVLKGGREIRQGLGIG